MRDSELKIAAKKIREFGQWDNHFRLFTIRFFGDQFDWTRFKVQAWRESAFKADAVSYCGARGVMQIMPETWVELEKQYSVRDPFNPEHSILAGIAYMRNLWTVWTKDHRNNGWPQDKIWQYALASYNGGRGNISKALTLSSRDGSNLTDWDHVKLLLGEVVRADNASQIINYVEDIEQLHRAL